MNITLGQLYPAINEAVGSQRTIAMQGSDGTNLRLIKTSTDGEVILGAGASDLFGASNPGAVTLSGNIVEIATLGSTTITAGNSLEIFANTNVSGFKSVLLYLPTSVSVSTITVQGRSLVTSTLGAGRFMNIEFGTLLGVGGRDRFTDWKEPYSDRLTIRVTNGEVSDITFNFALYGRRS